MKFPCKQCGAKLDFDPAAEALTCPFCNHVEKIDPDAATLEEHDFEKYLSMQADNVAIEGHSSETQCGACGATVLLEDKVATDRCPFCGTHLTTSPQVAKTMIAPESLLPAAVSREQAVVAFNAWVASRWFAPNELKRFANLGWMHGIYVPYWTYDSMTFTNYSGMRGDNYLDSETYIATNSKGQPEKRTRTVVRTRWTPASGRVNHFFNDTLVCASKSIPDNLAPALKNWDLSGLVAFKPDYLAGFKTERYAVGLGDGFIEAKKCIEPAIRQLCCQDIGGDHQTLSSVNTQYVGVTFKHLLLPIWLAAYRYHHETYRILVNARTGEVVGTRPYSWVKIALLVAVILLAIAIAAAISAAQS